MSAPPAALLLDLDGTLIDSRRDLAAGVNRLLAELKLPTLPDELVLSFVGRGARSLVRRCLLVADPDGRVPRDDRVLRGFLAHYNDVLLDTTVPFPGVPATLAALRDRGVPMAVVTNKPEAPAARIMDALGLREFVPLLLGGDTTPTKKPDPGPLLLAAVRLGVQLADCLMVGDSDVDIDAAENAGIPGLWCSWGGIHPDRPVGARYRLDRPEQLLDVALRGPDACL